LVTLTLSANEHNDWPFASDNAAGKRDVSNVGLGSVIQVEPQRRLVL
jgi:hypothetical protein